MRYLSLLLCLWCGAAAAASTPDPLHTGELLPLKPALRLNDAVGDPCTEAAPRAALDLYTTVNLALCDNPQTREVWASSRAQAAQVGVSRGSYLPGLSLSAAGNRDLPGDSRRSVELTLSYLLYDFGTRAANLENARQLLSAASATQDATVQSVFLSAVQAFYRAQAGESALAATQEAERAAKRSADAAEARYRAGSATPADRLQARTAWSQSTLDRITAEGTLNKARGALANVIGLDANRGVELSASQDGNPSRHGDGELKTFEQDVNALIEEAKRRRPDLAAAEAQLKAAEASAEATRGAALPSVSLSASSGQSESAGITSHDSSIGISVSVPLFAGYGPTYRIRAAEAQVESRQAQLDRARLQVALDVWNTWHDLTTATQSLRTAADLLESATQSERVASGRYAAGVGTMLDVLNAQSTLAGARRQRIQSLLNWNVGRAALAQAMGNLDAGLLQTLNDAPPTVGEKQP